MVLSVEDKQMVGWSNVIFPNLLESQEIVWNCRQNLNIFSLLRFVSANLWQEGKTWDKKRRAIVLVGQHSSHHPHTAEIFVSNYKIYLYLIAKYICLKLRQSICLKLQNVFV